MGLTKDQGGCDDCWGIGVTPMTKDLPCDTCKGTGIHPRKQMSYAIITLRDIERTDIGQAGDKAARALRELGYEVPTR